MPSRGEALQWFRERSLEPANQEHVDVTQLVAKSSNDDQVGECTKRFGVSSTVAQGPLSFL